MTHQLLIIPVDAGGRGSGSLSLCVSVCVCFSVVIMAAAHPESDPVGEDAITTAMRPCTTEISIKSRSELSVLYSL